MAQRSPTLEGFRAVFRAPALVLAEISWRWTFGAAACLLLLFGALQYLNSLTVTMGEQLFLRSRQPFLISQALAQIFAGSARRLLAAAMIAVPALAIFWMVAACFGRAATLRSLLEYFDCESGAREGNRRALLGLNFLRVVLAFVAVLAFFSTAMIAGFASPDADPSPGLAFFVFLPLASLVALLWSTLNWYLSIAPLFVVRDGHDAFAAIAATVHFARTQAAPVFWSSTAFGLLHFLIFIIASVLVLIPMTFASIVPPAITLIGIIFVTLIYFAVVDLLYVGRLAAYVAITQSGRSAASFSAYPMSPSPQPPPQVADEDNILCDIPGLVPPPEPEAS